jgi:hypothetical protein
MNGQIHRWANVTFLPGRFFFFSFNAPPYEIVTLFGTWERSRVSKRRRRAFSWILTTRGQLSRRATSMPCARLHPW